MRFDGLILRPQIDSSAGTSVTAAAIATTTTPRPPYAIDRSPPVKNSSPASETVNVLNRMFAWLAPQYSTHAPLNALAVVESGVYHR